MRIRVLRSVSVALLCLMFATALFASPVGNISGSVKDASGAFVAGVKVTLTNVGTNAKQETATDANGEFQFLQLAPASYSLAVEAKGFKRAVSNALVQVDQITHAEFNLEVGDVSQSVQVEASAPLLETDKSTLSSVVDSHTIESMPLNARQYLDLALLTPGALPASAGTQGGGFNVAGARSQSNVFLLDGVSMIDTQVNSALGNFRITDAVQEFAVQTSVATAEFGRGTGGQVSIVTKSGTNALHGSVFEYFRNSKLDAADFFTNRAGKAKNPLHRNQYGATLGGPIIKNRTFFFGSWEGFRQVAPTPSATRVPTDAERASVTDPISKALLQFWPAANTTGTTNFVANIGATTFDNTGLLRIDHRFNDNDQLSGRWAEYEGSVFTAGTLPSMGGNANTPISRSGVLIENHTFSPKLLNEFRFGFSRNQTFITVQDSGLDASKIFVDSAGKPLPGVVNASQNPLDSGLPTITVSGGFSPLGSTSNLPQGRITNTYEAYDNMSWIAPFGKSRHSWRWGYHIRREEARRFLDGSARGAFAFSSFADFAAGRVNTSTFLFGSTLAYTRRYPWDLYWQDQWKIKDNLTLNYGIRYEYPSAIAQTRLQGTNFVPGVGPVLLGTNKVLNIDPTKTGPASFFFTQAPSTLSDSGVTSDKNNFAPVIGFAYTPRFAKSVFGNDATVIRGGFRVGFDEIFNNIPANMALNAPYNLTTSQTAGVTQPDKFSWATGYNQSVPFISNFGKQGPGTPTSGVIGFSAEDPNIRSAYLYQYSFGIQRKIGTELSLEADYQGSTGHKLGLFIDQNEPTVIVRDPTKRGSVAPNEQIFPYSSFAAVSTGKDILNSNYNGVVFTAKYQGRRGVFVQGSYTFGKSLDYQSAFFGATGERTGPADAKNLRLEHGPSSFDIRHRFVAFYAIDLPIGPGHRLFGWNNGLNREVLGGWQISGITTLQTGAPFTVFNNANDFSGFNTFNDRPDVIGTGTLTQDNRSPDNAFDKTFFGATPPTGRVGTSGRNQYYGPGLANYNVSAGKNFPLFGERFKLRFQADFFNLFNHTNFANPTGNASSANFGKITATVGTATATAVGNTAGLVGGGPRVIQLAMRLVF
jgi:hypothetical protein